MHGVLELAASARACYRLAVLMDLDPVAVRAEKLIAPSLDADGAQHAPIIGRVPVRVFSVSSPVNVVDLERPRILEPASAAHTSELSV